MRKPEFEFHLVFIVKEFLFSAGENNFVRLCKLFIDF